MSKWVQPYVVVKAAQPSLGARLLRLFGYPQGPSRPGRHHAGQHVGGIVWTGYAIVRATALQQESDVGLVWEESSAMMASAASSVAWSSCDLRGKKAFSRLCKRPTALQSSIWSL